MTYDCQATEPAASGAYVYLKARQRLKFDKPDAKQSLVAHGSPCGLR